MKVTLTLEKLMDIISVIYPLDNRAVRVSFHNTFEEYTLVCRAEKYTLYCRDAYDHSECSQASFADMTELWCYVKEQANKRFTLDGISAR